MVAKTKPKVKTKEELQTRITFLEGELLETRKIARNVLDHWGKTLNDWKFWNKITIAHHIVAFLLGMAWGIMLFA